MHLKIGLLRQGGQIRCKGLQIPLAQLLRHLRQGTAVAVGALQMHGAGTETTAHVRLLQPMPDRSTPHRRQLSWIPHQQQPAPTGQRLQQSLGQGQIQHRHLVDHQQIQLQGTLAMPAKATASGLQPAVEGAAGQRSPLRHHRLPQAPGRLAGGGRQTDAQAGMAGFRPGQNLHHRAGFARARTTAEQHNRSLIRGAHGGALFSVETIRQLGIGSLDGFGKRSMGPLHQLGHHLLHGLQPAAPAQPITLEQQGGGIPLQPATGLGSGQPLRRQRNRQLPLLQGQHQIAAELLQGGAISPGRDPSPQGGMESGHEAGGPGAGSRGLQLRHAGTSPRARSRAAMRLSGTGSTMRPGPTAFSGEAITAPGIPRRKQ